MPDMDYSLTLNAMGLILKQLGFILPLWERNASSAEKTIAMEAITCTFSLILDANDELEENARLMCYSFIRTLSLLKEVQKEVTTTQQKMEMSSGEAWSGQEEAMWELSDHEMQLTSLNSLKSTTLESFGTLLRETHRHCFCVISQASTRTPLGVSSPSTLNTQRQKGLNLILDRYLTFVNGRKVMFQDMLRPEDWAIVME